MMNKMRRVWLLAGGGAVATGLVVLLVSGQAGAPLNRAVRTAALLGYVCIFLGILSSAFLRQLIRFFGRPFVKLHHMITVTGLVLITLHPLGVAMQGLGLQVLVPRTDSWQSFFLYGGIPAWYLIAVASLAAALRAFVGKQWRVIHFLNYIAFLLAMVHAFLIGTEFQYLWLRILSAIMVAVTIVVFVRNRTLKRKTKKNRSLAQ